MQQYRTAGDRKPQANRASSCIARLIYSDKRIKYALKHICGNARAMVSDRNLDFANQIIYPQLD
jgi:hypothetical protein